MRKSSLTWMYSLLSTLGALPEGKSHYVKNPKMELSDSELEHLKTLSGKDKKIFVKKLKEKYKKGIK